MDNNYFLLRISVYNKLEVYFYNLKLYKYCSLIYPICFNLSLIQYDQVVWLLSLCKPLDECSTSHKLYLGKEIFKAQLAIHLQHCYIQD